MQLESTPDLVWVASLAGASPRAAKKALEEAKSERGLFSHLTREHRSEGRPGYGEIDAPLELYALVRLLRPTHVVEVGVASGVSSAYLLAALEKNRHGTLHSVDLPRRPPARREEGEPKASWTIPLGRTSGWAVPFRLRKRWDLRLGDKAEVLPLLAQELPAIEMFVYDVPHACDRARKEFAALDARLPPGIVVIVDHGPGGGLCPALRSWARARHVATFPRIGTGLHGWGRTPARRSNHRG